MKQHNRTQRTSQQQPPWADQKTKHSGRRLMNRGCRRLFLFLLALLVLLSLLAALAAWKPWYFTWNALTLRYEREHQTDYKVILDPTAIPGVAEAPSDAFYLDELVNAVKPSFSIRLKTDRPVNAQVRSSLKAVIQARETGEGQPVLLRVGETILESKSFPLTAATQLEASQQYNLSLDPYRERAASMATQLNQPLDYELLLIFSVVYTIDTAGVQQAIQENSSLLIPLNKAVFSINRVAEDKLAAETIRRPLQYRIHLTLFPWPVFLIVALLSFASFLVLALTTRGRPKDCFHRTLRRMRKMTHGYLLMIGDKAWDPAWCIRVTDFRSMAKAARRLKHPVFCYVDELSAWPAAYFFSVYGENNYCHIYTEHPDLLEESFLTPQKQPDQVESADDDFVMPVLPETDEVPLGSGSGETKIIRPDRPLHDPSGQEPNENMDNSPGNSKT